MVLHTAPSLSYDLTAPFRTARQGGVVVPTQRLKETTVDGTWYEYTTVSAWPSASKRLPDKNGLAPLTGKAVDPTGQAVDRMHKNPWRSTAASIPDGGHVQGQDQSETREATPFAGDAAPFAQPPVCIIQRMLHQLAHGRFSSTPLTPSLAAGRRWRRLPHPSSTWQW